MTLKEIRTFLGFSQRQFAEALGVSRNYITLIEMGKRTPSGDLQRKAAELANVKESANSNGYDKFADTAYARLASIDARLATIEQLLLKLLAKPAAKAKS